MDILANNLLCVVFNGITHFHDGGISAHEFNDEMRMWSEAGGSLEYMVKRSKNACSLRKQWAIIFDMAIYTLNE